MSERNSPSAEANVGPILLDIEVNGKWHSVRGKSDLDAVHTLLLAPDAMIMIMYCVCNQKYFPGLVSDACISCHRNLPPEMLRYLYNDFVPELATFRIYLPGVANCSFKESDYSNGCKTEKLRCSCCSYQRYDIQDCKSGWVCEELQNVYYAETRERNAKETTTPKGDAPSFKTPQEPIELTPDTITFRQLSKTQSRSRDERNFALTGQKFFFLSNHVSKRRIVFTNKPLPSEPHYSDEFPTLSLMKLLGIRIVCDEWDKMIQAYKLQLNDVRKEIVIRDKPDPRSILLTLDKAGEAASELENMHNVQLQLLHSLYGLSWYKGLEKQYTDILGPTKRMEEFGNTIQESISKKVDSLFQRASNIVSIEEAFKSREQGASMKRLSWITFIFLPLLFVASLYGMNIDLLANNPSWTTCFYIGAPVFLAVMATVSILKCRKIPDKKTKIRDMIVNLILKYRTILLEKTKIRDEENPTTTAPSTSSEHWLLFDAAEQGNAGRIRAMIERNFHLDVRNENGWNPLQLAARNGHEEVVDLILKNDTVKSSPGIVNAPPARQNGRTALQAAAENGHEHIVIRLLGHKADVNAEPGEQNGRTALQAAAGTGHGEIVNSLLNAGANVNAIPCWKNGRTALQAAAENSHGDTVNLLLNAHADVNAKPGDVHGRTALQAAAGSGHGDIVNSLLNAGANVNAIPCWKNGRTALQAAAGSGHGEIVDRLLNSGADINAEPGMGDGRTALQAAAESGHREIVDRLLEVGADVNAQPCLYNGRTALQAAAESGQEDIVNRLLDAGVDFNTTPGRVNGRTALQAAAESGHREIIDRLLEVGADVNAEPSEWDGRTALQAAAGSGHGDIVSCLLDAGADVNADPCRENGRTALQAAAENSHGDTVNLLLNAHADVNAKPGDVHGRTALQAAAGSGHGDIVSCLLDAGADVNADPCRENGRTALQAAAENGRGDTVSLLLNAHADVNAKPGDVHGRTALQAAAENGHGDTVNLLLNAHADVNAKPGDVHGRTALQAAAGSGHKEIVDRLLEADADVNADPCRKYGRTALQAAAESGHGDTVNRLLNAGADVNSRPGIIRGITALQAAAEGGHLDVVKHLLRAGVSPNSRSETVRNGRGTALDLAERHGHTQVVDVLRAAGSETTDTYFRRVTQAFYSVYDCRASRINRFYWLYLKRRMPDGSKW